VLTPHAAAKLAWGCEHQEHPMSRKTTIVEAVATIGIDIGKNTFHLIGLDKKGAIVLRQKLSRSQVAVHGFHWSESCRSTVAFFQ
jgi:hypothetical protein